MWNKAALTRNKVTIAYFVISLICIYLFAEIVDDVFYDPAEGDMETPNFDLFVMSQVKQLRHGVLVQSMTDITALGSFSVITLFVLFLSVVLLYLKDRVGLLYLLVNAFGAAALPTLLKSSFGRVRPDITGHLVTVETSSFPSGHAFAATTVYFAFAYLGSERVWDWKLQSAFYFAASLLVLLVAFSRIFLGVHFPSDVFAGITGGLAWCFTLSAYFTHRKNTGKDKEI